MTSAKYILQHKKKENQFRFLSLEAFFLFAFPFMHRIGLLQHIILSCCVSEVNTKFLLGFEHQFVH